jgi:hypothetical protein
MNPPHNNPFGVIQGMGRSGQEPQYHSVGAWNGQAWSVYDRRYETFTDECYDRGGYPYSPGGYHHGYHGYPSYLPGPNGKAWLYAQTASPVKPPNSADPYNNSNQCSQGRPYLTLLGPMTR